MNSLLFYVLLYRTLDGEHCQTDREDLFTNSLKNIQIWFIGCSKPTGRI